MVEGFENLLGYTLQDGETIVQVEAFKFFEIFPKIVWDLESKAETVGDENPKFYLFLTAQTTGDVQLFDRAGARARELENVVTTNIVQDAVDVSPIVTMG
jgi:hypothetical protein